MSEQERREAMDRRQKLVAQSSDQGLRQNPPQLGPPQQCPRCESFNTKFCYYNNYSLSQPRFFCKACRRYWTRGGTLRNVPVGGGCRKTKRSKPSSPSSSSGESPPSRPLPPPQPSFGSESIATSPGISSLTPPSRPSPPPGSLASPPMSTFFAGGGGFLPLGFINSPLITQADVSASKSIRGSSSASNITIGDLGLLQGFELPSFGLQRQLQTSDGGGLVSVPASTRPVNVNGWPLSFNTAASSSANLSLNPTAGSDAVGFWSVANSGDAGVSGGA